MVQTKKGKGHGHVEVEAEVVVWSVETSKQNNDDDYCFAKRIPLYYTLVDNSGNRTRTRTCITFNKQGEPERWGVVTFSFVALSCRIHHTNYWVVLFRDYLERR